MCQTSCSPDSFNYNLPDRAIVFNYTPETQFRVVSMFVAGSEYEERRITANLEDVNCAVRGVNEAGDCSAAALEEPPSADHLHAAVFHRWPLPICGEVLLLRAAGERGAGVLPAPATGRDARSAELSPTNATIDVPEEYAALNCPPGWRVDGRRGP
ncbi:MAG: hypothetical protein R3B40_18995 [Polyangiales bacterium]